MYERRTQMRIKQKIKLSLICEDCKRHVPFIYVWRDKMLIKRERVLVIYRTYWSIAKIQRRVIRQPIPIIRDSYRSINK